MAQPTKVFVGSLPPGTKPEELRHLFENYGIVVECDVMNRCGFVHMKNAAMADSAILALNGSDFRGQNIVVEHGRPKERKQGVGGVIRGGINQGVGGNVGPRGGSRGIMVGFPGKQNSNFNQAATLQLAGVIMELLGDQQKQTDDISGGSNMRRVGGGGVGGEVDFRRGGPQGGNSNRSGNFQSGSRGGKQNINGLGPMRNQSFKNDRPAPYPQVINLAGPNAYQGGRISQGGGRFNNPGNNVGAGERGRNAGGSSSNYNNTRGDNFVSKSTANDFGGNNLWTNEQRGSGLSHQGGRNFADDNISRGFMGNMGNSSGAGGSGSGGNYGRQQDRRGFTLPSNQFQQYGGRSGNQSGGFSSGDGGVSFNDDLVFQRRSNPSNMGGANRGGSNNFNRAGNQSGRGGVTGGFQNNRGGHGFQQGGGFKRGGPGNNNSSGDNYQQNFPPLGGGGGFINNRNQGGSRGAGVMNRNVPRQNMPNRRY